MYIGKVSRLTGASPKAIRLYEKLGLIPSPDRIGKYRNYGHKDVELIRIIKQAQRLGFKLSEIQELLDDDASCDSFPWDKAVALMLEKQQYIRKEIEKLRILQSKLIAFTGMLKKKKCDR